MLSKLKISLTFAGLYLAVLPAFAQHDHHSKPDSSSHSDHGTHSTHAPTPPATHSEHQQAVMLMDGSAESRSHMEAMQKDSEVPLGHSYSLNLPMTRNGSGTGWLPDASPMYGYTAQSRKWLYMFHGNVFLRYNKQDLTDKGSRGDSKIDAPNWLMAMGQRRVGQRGLFHFNTMFSLDPLFGGEGYPLLFQTGETFEGKPLVDRQHPHNLFSELSVAYSHALSPNADAFVYLGYPGEPALGPVAFMHRPSSQNILDSPLGHHWQDATHITFGVATAGFRYKILKVEGSLFTGREPGEARYGLDKPRFDSYSYRLSVNPSPNWALQVSQGYLKSPEPVAPDENVWRTTASALHSLPLRAGNYNLTSSLIWGYNNAGGHHKEHSLTLESNLQLDRFAVYGRYEWVQKSGDELQVNGQGEEPIFDIQAITLGTNYTLFEALNTRVAFGIQGSLYLPDERLNPIYGKNPIAGQVFIRLYPGLMRMKM